MINADLVAKARDVGLLATAESLGAQLKRVNKHELAGPCPRCGGVDRFNVNTKRQVWHCRHCDKGGNVIALVMHVRELDFREAVAFLAGGEASPAPTRPRPAAEPEDDGSNAFVERLIAGLVREFVPMRRTPGEQYLAEARKIDTEAIADVLQRTDAIGWHPSVLFRENGHALDGRRLGCIVGVMTEPVSGRPTGAISRTYIHEGRKVGKAKTLGKPAGIVRLSADEDVLEGLHLTEGMETGLAAMAAGFRPCWSTGSSGLMAAFPLLNGVEALTLIADNDANEAGIRAARTAAERWLAGRREARIVRPKAIGDFNDIVMWREGPRRTRVQKTIRTSSSSFLPWAGSGRPRRKTRRSRVSAPSSSFAPSMSRLPK